MSTLRRTACYAAAVTAGALLSVAGYAAAAPLHATATIDTTTDASHAYPCGYDGYVDGSRQPVYTHCGPGGVVIAVDHFFWATTYACLPSGSWHIPQGGSRWSIIGAAADGHSCAGGAAAIEGP